ncbi:leucine rich repeat domain protein [Aspergillus saccharolyticus JOP 1030-1]|uniref:Leucine rich repeat domain protein n=1 Tax=Aspergillus saccharolyticus JOP 1030-1 TaxID=1450539 RepID=A0A319A1G4_9EURO|nr:leucine rich repeat domain protein [Aspergillus saccharolyticus JOP 1030-1]PYH46128.1 leucine rich repeat domain protein [Aspergillus saccharolyticus JOP 1030-1]
MDTVPPSYQSATARDAWSIIAQYIPSSDLCAVALVCRRWHELFMPFLWGDPASHFGTENDAVYVALTRFRRTLKYARLEVRMLTHTLHLPPALSEIYGGPRPEWLREILDSLPCLQSLIVSKLPFFDHNAMMALKGTSRGLEAEATPARVYNIRLLLADNEYNTTSQGIAETLLVLPELTYLDLSYTTPARDRLVLSVLSQLEHLQVLKLRGIGLRDHDAEFLANAIGYRVRFLDLRNNMLTDMAVRSLLQACFRPASNLTNEIGPARSGTWGSLTHASHPMSHSSVQRFLSSPFLDEKYMAALTQPLTGCSWVEDLSQEGITHLYIAYNPISVEGAASLLASSCLHALDVGTVNTAESMNGRRQRPWAFPHEDPQELPGAEKLVPILGSITNKTLTYLRAHHALCTAEAMTKEATSPGALLPELPAESDYGEQHRSELDCTQEIHELPSGSTPIYELSGTPVSRSSSPPPHAAERNSGPIVYEDETLPEQRRGSVFAPEVVEGSFRDGVGHEEVAPLSRLPHDLSISSISTLADSVVNTLGSQTLCSSPVAKYDPRTQKVQELLSKRPKGLPRRNSRECHFYPHLHPSHISHLEQLVLTDVPSHVPADSPILASLLGFITACSNESLLATLQAGSDYSLPPGQARLQAEQERARSLFALRQLVLEITPTSPRQGQLRRTPWRPAGSLKSSTGDRDLENLWSAAADDFSFFGEEECGVPDGYSGKYFPMAVLNEKVSLRPEEEDVNKLSAHPDTSAVQFPNSVLTSQHLSLQAWSRAISVGSASATRESRSQGQSDITTTRQDPVPKVSQAEVPLIDLVAELAAFRRAKKMEYEEGVWRDRKRRDTVGTTNSSHLSHLSPSPSTAISSFRSPSPSPSFISSTGQLSSFQSISHFVEGHWKGEVKIIRNPAPKGRSGVVDMYGNYFEKGYLYP